MDHTKPNHDARPGEVIIDDPLLRAAEAQKTPDNVKQFPHLDQMVQAAQQRRADARDEKLPEAYGDELFQRYVEQMNQSVMWLSDIDFPLFISMIDEAIKMEDIDSGERSLLRSLRRLAVSCKSIAMKVPAGVVEGGGEDSAPDNVEPIKPEPRGLRSWLSRLKFWGNKQPVNVSQG